MSTFFRASELTVSALIDHILSVKLNYCAESAFMFSQFEDDEFFQFAGIQFALDSTVFVPGFFWQLEVSLLNAMHISIITHSKCVLFHCLPDSSGQST